MNMTNAEAIRLLQMLPPESTFGVRKGKRIEMDFLPLGTDYCELKVATINHSTHKEEKIMIKNFAEAGILPDANRDYTATEFMDYMEAWDKKQKESAETKVEE